MKRLSTGEVKHFLRQTFLIGLIISLSVYGWVRMLFFEVPFTVKEDVLNVLKIVMTGWLLIILLKLTFYSILEGVKRLQKVRVADVRKEEKAPVSYPRTVFKTINSSFSASGAAVNS
jgi:hypothetical protein